MLIDMVDWVTGGPGDSRAVRAFRETACLDDRDEMLNLIDQTL
jgi:hypothetical protein